jgi:hypothetical protein
MSIPYQRVPATENVPERLRLSESASDKYSRAAEGRNADWQWIRAPLSPARDMKSKACNRCNEEGGAYLLGTSI